MTSVRTPSSRLYYWKNAWNRSTECHWFAARALKDVPGHWKNTSVDHPGYRGGGTYGLPLGNIKMLSDNNWHCSGGGFDCSNHPQAAVAEAKNFNANISCAFRFPHGGDNFVCPIKKQFRFPRWKKAKENGISLCYHPQALNSPYEANVIRLPEKTSLIFNFEMDVVWWSIPVSICCIIKKYPIDFY